MVKVVFFVDYLALRLCTFVEYIMDYIYNLLFLEFFENFQFNFHLEK
jgi:hypothetical protein